MEKSKRPIIYVSSPYAGDIDQHVKDARKFCRYVVNHGGIPVAPHLMFPQFMSEEHERYEALSFGLKLLDMCDELWAFGAGISYGMSKEIEYMHKAGKPVKDFTGENMFKITDSLFEKIVVVVQGGLVQEVYARDKQTEVQIIDLDYGDDWNYSKVNDDAIEMLNDAVERGDLTAIY